MLSAVRQTNYVLVNPPR